MTTAVQRLNDDFLDSLLTDCEPTTANDLVGVSGFSPFEFPIKCNTAFTSPSITPSNVAPSMSPSQSKTISGPIPEMKLERAPSPDSVSVPTKRAFDDIIECSSPKALKVTLVDGGASPKGGPPATKKRKQEDRRERKNQREKQRRTELNALFDNMVDLLGLPKETKADKVTVLASAINTIRQLRSTIRPELLELVQERNLFSVPVPETCEAAQQAVKKQQEAAQHVVPVPADVVAQPAPVRVTVVAPPQPVLAAQPVFLQQPAAPSASIDDLTYFDPGSVFADM